MRATEEEILESARKHSGGDPIVEEILVWHMQYLGSAKPSEPSVKDGIKFWAVGHNASHSFSAGVKDGQRYRSAFGEEGWDEVDDTPIHKESIRRVESFDGYYGHF